MRKLPALFLVLTLAVNTAFAGLNSKKAKYLGGTAAIPTQAIGFLVTTDQSDLNFGYQKGRANNKDFPPGQFSFPYASITFFSYGQHANLRIGQTIALAAVAGAGGLLLLLSKSHSHYLTIQYKDEKGKEQSVVFELGKDEVRPVISSLEVRTGKKVEFEDDAASKVFNGK